MAKKNQKTEVVEAQEVLNKSEALIVKYKKPIIIALVAIIAIVVGVYCYNNYYKAPREAKASTTLAKGQELVANQQYDKALKGDGAAFGGLIKLADEFSGTDAGNLANLYAGLCYARQEKPDYKKAIEYLEKYDCGEDILISPAAKSALGDAYASDKQLDKAIECFKEAAKMADKQAANDMSTALAPYFLVKAGVLLESQGKKAEALEIYKDIKKKYVNSPYYNEVDKYIERASN
ncbi:MAG: tetratricopeptide repeat protein [Prevotella sp.]|nr:tetratricopeptide repeat protein [Prevotella sp.]